MREDTVGEAVRAGQPVSVTVTAGDAMGVPVRASVDSDGDGFCALASTFTTG